MVYELGGKYLLEQRREEDLYKDVYTFPGGKVEPRDYRRKKGYLFGASFREAKEEGSLIPKEIIPFVKFEDVTRNGNHFIFHGIWVPKYYGVVLDNEENKRKWHWVPGSEVGLLVADTSTNSRVWKSYLLFRGLKY